MSQNNIVLLVPPFSFRSNKQSDHARLLQLAQSSNEVAGVAQYQTIMPRILKA
jgi:hypothetical protein